MATKVRRSQLQVLLAATAGAAAVLLAGCEEKRSARKYDEPVTIVVEADKTRLAEQEAALAERSRSIEAESEKLKALYEKMEAVQGEKLSGAGGESPQAGELARLAMKLIKERQEIDAQQRAMIKDQAALIQKVTEGGRLPVAPGTGAAPGPAAAPPAGGASGASVAELTRLTGQVAGREKELASRERSLAEREASLAEREKALAGREAALAARDSACVAAAAAAAAAAPHPRKGGGGAGLSKGEVERAYKDLLAAMTSKGVLPSDLPAAKQRALKDARNFNKGELAAAMDAIEQVTAAVNGIAIDGPFVAEKTNRVGALQRASRNAKAKEEVTRLLGEVTRAYSDGRYAEANRGLNNIVHVLEKP